MFYTDKAVNARQCPSMPVNATTSFGKVTGAIDTGPDECSPPPAVRLEDATPLSRMDDLPLDRVFYIVLEWSQQTDTPHLSGSLAGWDQLFAVVQTQGAHLPLPSLRV